MVKIIIVACIAITITFALLNYNAQTVDMTIGEMFGIIVLLCSILAVLEWKD